MEEKILKLLRFIVVILSIMFLIGHGGTLVIVVATFKVLVDEGGLIGAISIIVRQTIGFVLNLSLIRYNVMDEKFERIKNLKYIAYNSIALGFVHLLSNFLYVAEHIREIGIIRETMFIYLVLSFIALEYFFSLDKNITEEKIIEEKRIEELFLNR